MRLMDYEEDVRIEALKCIGEAAVEDPTCVTEDIIVKACERIMDKKVLVRSVVGAVTVGKYLSPVVYRLALKSP